MMPIDGFRSDEGVSIGPNAAISRQCCSSRSSGFSEAQKQPQQWLQQDSRRITRCLRCSSSCSNSNGSAAAAAAAAP